MRAALAAAGEARAAGEDPFGAVLLDPEGAQVIAAHDESIHSADPTRHAEVVALSRYCSAVSTVSLAGFTLVCSAEPCVMCAGAAHWAKVSRVVFSVSQDVLRGLTGGRPKPCASTLQADLAFSLIGPVLQDEGLRVFDGYQWSRKAERIDRR